MLTAMLLLSLGSLPTQGGCGVSLAPRSHLVYDPVHLPVGGAQLVDGGQGQQGHDAVQQLQGEGQQPGTRGVEGRRHLGLPKKTPQLSRPYLTSINALLALHFVLCVVFVYFVLSSSFSHDTKHRRKVAWRDTSEPRVRRISWVRTNEVGVRRRKSAMEDREETSNVFGSSTDCQTG